MKLRWFSGSLFSNETMAEETFYIGGLGPIFHKKNIRIREAKKQGMMRFFLPQGEKVRDPSSKSLASH